MGETRFEIKENFLFTEEELEKLWEDENGWVTTIPGITSITSRFIYKRINGVVHFKDLSAAYQEKKKKTANNKIFEDRLERDFDNDRAHESELERLRNESLRAEEEEQRRRRDYDDWLDYNYAAMEMENQRYEEERRREFEEQTRINLERDNEWYN
jgi:hypothetical protein